MPTPLEQRLPPNPYRNLVLLALTTLSGHRDSPGLLEDAHRLVTGALPRGRRHPRPHEYARTRRRVLRRSLHPRSWHPRGQAGLRVPAAARAAGPACASAGTTAAGWLARCWSLGPAGERGLWWPGSVRAAGTVAT